jgi:hypothetical protein
MSPIAATAANSPRIQDELVTSAQLMVGMAAAAKPPVASHATHRLLRTTSSYQMWEVKERGTKKSSASLNHDDQCELLVWYKYPNSHRPDGDQREDARGNTEAEKSVMNLDSDVVEKIVLLIEYSGGLEVGGKSKDDERENENEDESHQAVDAESGHRG